MRVLLQRVGRAEVRVAGSVRGSIGPGILALVGVGPSDDAAVARAMADRSVDLRIFRDDEGRTNHSLVDVGGSMLVVSQFTLYGDTRKGRRPSFIGAAEPGLAAELVEVFARSVEAREVEVARGEFGAEMEVELVNDGPMTIWLDSGILSVAGSPLTDRIRNRALRLRQHRWRMAAHQSPHRHIVLGGAPRSGTTLLRNLLDRHPGIRAGAETKLLVPAAFNLAWLAEAYRVPQADLEDMRRRSASQAAFVDAFAERVTSMDDKARWAEKTPQNIRHLDWILARFPRASVVHIIRDGRDVVCSMREHPDWRWRDGAWQKVIVDRPLAWYAQRWLADTAAGMAWREDPRYVEVRYEDLVADPTAVMRTVGHAVGEPAGDDWLASVGRRDAADDEGPGPDEGWGVDEGPAADAGPRTGSGSRPDYEGPVSDASVGRWRAGLRGDELREIMRLCERRLDELGYEP